MIYEETCGERETGPINGESTYLAWGDVGRCDGDHGTHAPCPTGSPRATCRGAASTAPHRAQRCQSTSRASRTAPPARRWRERACSSVSFRSRRTPIAFIRGLAGGKRAPLPNKGPLALKVRLAARPPRVAPPQQRAKGGRREWALHLRDKKRRRSRASAAWMLEGGYEYTYTQEKLCKCN